MFNEVEKKWLSASLGNLLLLSQSINSSLQNDSFPDKKNPSPESPRGYVNGSHSEIEVAQEADWTAQNILKRGLSLLGFMESRWRLTLSEDEKSELLHISFVNDGRPEGPEISPAGFGEEEGKSKHATPKAIRSAYRRAVKKGDQKKAKELLAEMAERWGIKYDYHGGRKA